MKLIRSLLFVFLLVLSIALQAQVSYSDSLKRELENSFGDKKLPILFDLSHYFLKESSKQVRKYANEALHLSEQYEDTSNIALSYSFLGASYVMEASYDTAFNLFFKGILLAEIIDDNKVKAKLYNNIATLYDLVKDESNAFKYYRLAVESIKKAGITNVYLPQLSLASLYCQENQIEKAKDIYYQVINNAIQNNDEIAHVLGLLNLLESLSRHQQISKSEFYKINDSIKVLSEKINNREYRFRLDKINCHYLFNNGSYQKSIATSQFILKDSAISLFTKKEIILLVSESFKRLNNYKDALYYRILYDSIQNSHNEEVFKKLTLNQNAVFKLANQEMIMEQIEHDRLAEKKEMKNNRIYLQVSILIIIFLGIMIVVLLFFYHQSINRYNKEKHLLNNQSNISYMQNEILAHNFYNCPSFQLNSSFIYFSGNTQFIELAGKETIQDIVGCNDFDLKWSDNVQKINQFYASVKKNQKEQLIDGSMWYLQPGMYVLAVPLIKQGIFDGIHGFILSKEMLNPINNQNQMTPNMEKIVNLDKEKNKQDIVRVLVVDDQFDNLLLIKSYLKKPMIELSAVQNGNDAIEKANEILFDYILMDIKMPDLDGIETTTIIREETFNTKTKIFALTASNSDDEYLKSSNLFDDVVHKPISKKELFHKLSISLEA